METLSVEVNMSVEEGAAMASKLKKETQKAPCYKLCTGLKAPQVSHTGSAGELQMAEAPKQIKCEPEEGLKQHWEAQWQEFLRMLRDPDSRWGNPRVATQPTPWEDAKAFLASFEQVASACRWPYDKWVTLLLPALSGEAEQGFSSLSGRDREDYGKVKAAILQREAVVREKQRQHFRQFCYQEVEGPRAVYGRLQQLCRQWLKTERSSKEEILELLILEQFLTILPQEMQSWVRERGPESCAQAVSLAEDYLLKQNTQKREGQVLPLFGVVGVDSSETDQIPSSDASKSRLGKIAKQPRKADEGSYGDQQGCENEMTDLQQGNSVLLAPKEELAEGDRSFHYYEEVTRLQIHQRSEKEEGDHPEENEAKAGLYWEGDSGSGENKVQQNIMCGSKESRLDSCQWSSGVPGHQNIHSIEKVPYQEEASNPGPILVQNKMIHLAEKLHKCSYCGTSFSHSSSLTVHEKIHTGVLERLHLQPLELQDPSSRREKSSQSYEEKAQLGGEEGSKAEKNMEGALLSKGGNVRWEDVKGLPRLYHCYCGRSFRHRCNLKAHERTHTGERPHKCSICGRSFGKGSTLRAHVRTHTGEKPYMCSTCGKRFTTRSSLLTHERIHTGEKPYKCSDCGRSFIQKSCLVAHEISHKGEKSYTCLDCGKNFGHSSGLRVHRRIHSERKAIEKP